MHVLTYFFSSSSSLTLPLPHPSPFSPSPIYTTVISKSSKNTTVATLL